MNGWMLALSGCCGGDAPVWAEVPAVWLEGEAQVVDLAPFLADDRGAPILEATRTDDVLVEVVGTTLELTPQPGWLGTTTIAVDAVDGCGNVSTLQLVVHGGSEVEGGCLTSFAWAGTADAVHVAGPFNNWDPEATPLTLTDGVWTAEVPLPAGDHPYKFAITSAGGFGGEPLWSCDPDAAYIQCDPDYKSPADTSWFQECVPGGRGCNSVVRVAACDVPVLTLPSLAVDRAAGRVELAVEGSGDLEVLLDGVVRDVPGPSFQFDALAPGRHVVEVRAPGAESLIVPFWTDDFAWEQSTLYFAFIDRMRNGDPSNDGDEGASAPGGRYLGGDFVGLQGMLPYLEDLGVGVLWISNPQDNAEGAWAGDCGATYAGYHAYWPDDPEAVEEHFGDEAALRALIDDAHARGIRVIMDWVGNHVHETHPWATEHPDWFNEPANCLDYVNGQINFDRIPETCRFAPYLPDLDYSRPEPLFRMVDDAVGWARRFQLDGFRIDAVKHMPHAVVWDVNAAVEEHIEHRAAGGDERFWTIGETFDGSRDRIASYVADEQLDGQFDFPMYFALRGAFARNDALTDLFGAMVASEDRYDGLMSVFLGNHDIPRFTTEAVGGDFGACRNGSLVAAPAPADAEPYDRLRLGFSVVFTQPAVPLVYYGDELGVPGYGDPDNRHPLWWYADLGAVQSAADLADQLPGPQAEVVRHVRALANARREHPSFAAPGATQWWGEPGVLAYSRSAAADHVLVIVNRDPDARVLTNGLAFAGLPQGTWTDVLTGAQFTSAGDQLTVDVGGRSSRVLVSP